LILAILIKYFNPKVLKGITALAGAVGGINAVARILIVDDAKFMRLTLNNILKKAEHEVVAEADNGLKAVKLYRELQPDLVTMDITMPEMDGIEAVKQIKSEFPDAKIIMCSAMGQQKMVVEAIEAGAKDFLVKPFDEHRVIDAINRVLKL
jgi:two-component system, chemotaxis family, chemotaxis protein CheY